jgi:hypothetical protein
MKQRTMNSPSPRRKNSSNDKLQKEIESRANYSLAVLGMAFVWNGSGKFLNIREPRKI